MGKTLKIQLPEGWDGVPIGHYCDYMALNASREPRKINGVELEPDRELNTADCLIDLAILFTGESYETVMQMSFPSLRLIAQHLHDLLRSPIPEKLTEVWKHDGIEYVCAPDITKMCAGQYVDFMSCSETNLDAQTNIDLFCAIVYRPANEAYGDTPMRERAKIFREHMTMDVAYPVTVFFCKVFDNLMSSMKAHQIDVGEKKLKKAMSIVRSEMNGTDSTSTTDG